MTNKSKVSILLLAETARNPSPDFGPFEDVGGDDWGCDDDEGQRHKTTDQGQKGLFEVWAWGESKTSAIIYYFYECDHLLNSKGINPPLPTFFRPIQHITGKQFNNFDLESVQLS